MFIQRLFFWAAFCCLSLLLAVPGFAASSQPAEAARVIAVTPGAFVFWLVLALLLGFWSGIGIGYLLWGRYKTKKTHSGPRVIGE